MNKFISGTTPAALRPGPPAASSHTGGGLCPWELDKGCSDVPLKRRLNPISRPAILKWSRFMMIWQDCIQPTHRVSIREDLCWVLNQQIHIRQAWESCAHLKAHHTNTCTALMVPLHGALLGSRAAMPNDKTKKALSPQNGILTSASSHQFYTCNGEECNDTGNLYLSVASAGPAQAGDHANAKRQHIAAETITWTKPQISPRSRPPAYRHHKLEPRWSHACQQGDETWTVSTAEKARSM